MDTETLLRLPNFLKRFGAVHGLRLGLTLRGTGSDVLAPEQSVQVPGYPAPVWMRPTRSDYSIFWQCLVQGQYDLTGFPQTAELLHRAKAMREAGSVPVIVDGGGNIGFAMREFARHYPFTHIVSVEPDQHNMRVLRRNAGELTAGAVTPVLGAVASVSGHCRVIGQERGSAGLMTEICEENAPGAVRAYTIPELVALVPGGRPWIVKLDIEGAQAELFSQNLDWIADSDLIILELDDWAFPWSGSGVNFFRALSAHRFDFLLHGELILACRHA